MAPAMATARLRKELVKLQKDPPPGVIAEPDESNILKWHYAIKGPSDTGFEGGIYVGKLVFPNEYPMKPPGIMMLTPSGRFKCSMRLCLSMSDYHPESWNPMWSVATIIQGVQSFMASDEQTTGGIQSPVTEHRRLAAESMDYNKKMFPNLFGGDIEAAFNGVDATSSDMLKPADGSSTDFSTSAVRDEIQDCSKVTGPRRAKRDKQPPLPTSDDTVVDESMVDSLVLDDEAQQELSPEEHEKRRERNAKRRAKQRQKREGTPSSK